MTAQKFTKPTNAQHAASPAFLLAMKPREFDREKIVGVLGERTVATYQALANEFGVSVTTVRQNWRANGMPGEKGKYSLADVALWKLERNAEHEKFMQPASERNDRLKDIEVERAELALKKEQDAYREKHGRFVDVEQARAELYAVLCWLREGLLTIPRGLMPLLPASVAETIGVECEKLIRSKLTALGGKQVCEMKIGECKPRSKAATNGKPKRKARCNGKP